MKAAMNERANAGQRAGALPVETACMILRMSGVVPMLPASFADRGALAGTLTQLTRQKSHARGLGRLRKRSKASESNGQWSWVQRKLHGSHDGSAEQCTGSTHTHTHTHTLARPLLPGQTAPDTDEVPSTGIISF